MSGLTPKRAPTGRLRHALTMVTVAAAASGLTAALVFSTSGAAAAPMATPAGPAVSSAAPAMGAPSPAPGRVSADTKYTTRLYGADPFQTAVAVTNHVYPAITAPNAPGEVNNVNDRPWGVVLITADDPLAGIAATELVHFPDDAPILYVTDKGIPAVTQTELKRILPTGISRAPGNIDAIVVGKAANPGVLNALHGLGLKAHSITGTDPAALANQIDAYYGSIQNPATGVPQMETSASTGGNGVQDVMIGATTAWQYFLPATHWASHMPTGMLWATKDSLPAPTIAALKRRGGHATIYVWGGPQQISDQVVRQLGQYGSVTRITNDDGVAYNTPPVNTPMATSIAFSKMWDPVGMTGWNITGPGHGLTLININSKYAWQDAVGSAILSHLGFHAPLLLTTSDKKLPPELSGYYSMIAPSFLVSPADGPYNMTYVPGSYGEVSWTEQVQADELSGMSNRHVWSQHTGSPYVRPAG